MAIDPQTLHAAVRHLTHADERLGAWIERFGPCTLSVDPAGGPFAALIAAIVSQQLHGKAATTIHGRLCALAGRKHPRPADIERLSDVELRGAGLSRQKLLSLRDLTAHARDGRFLRGLARLDDEALVERLTRVRGIGRWTVEMLLIFRLGRLDVLPVDDYGVRKGAQRVYRMRQPPGPARLMRLGERWRPYRSVASWYLWRAAEAPA